MKYFIWRKVLSIHDETQFSPAIWGDDLTTGTGRFHNGEVKSFEEAEQGDLVFFHTITQQDLEDWSEAKLNGVFGSALSFFAFKYPLPKPKPIIREQDLFPEGEG